MRNEMSEENFLRAVAFLKEKLYAHSDSISMDQYSHLFSIDKNRMIIISALEYASDANANPNNITEMDALIEAVGNKIDTMQDEYNKNAACYTPDKEKQMETMLRDLQIVHFGLIAVFGCSMTKYEEEK